MDLLKELQQPVQYIIVNEAGASVYSASKLATEEFPQFDVGQRLSLIHILQPYTMVKDHRTNAETGNVNSVLDGALDLFIYAYLRWIGTGAKANDSTGTNTL